jgi:hypothetical protein
MTRLVTCGWETGDPYEDLATNNGSPSVRSSSPAPRLGGSYYVTSNGAKTFTLPAAKTEIWVRFAEYLIGSGIVPLAFFDSAGQYQCVLNVNGAVLTLLLGNTATVLATSILPMAGGVWHLLEVRYQVASLTAGTVEVWLDGTRVINYTGDCVAAANANVQGVMLQLGNVAFLDDLAINDTLGTLNNGRPGDGCVVLLKPNGAGSNTAQSRGGTDSGANWSQVDEVPSSTTDYVYSSTVGARDTYALENLPAGVNAVNCCDLVVTALNSDVGTGSIGLTLKSGATTNEGTAQPLGITPQTFHQFFEVDPNTSASWTVAAVNALEAGTTVR